jgi:lipoate-protein ligase A
MAVDEALLASAAQRKAATLRFYGWEHPTLSLGYFQSIAERASHPASTACPCVRRTSGGGAILHDHEVTYSLVLPASNPAAATARGLMQAVHETLIEALSGLAPGRLRLAAGRQGGDVESFLCFLRRERGDVLLDDTKIAGSAQRRRRGSVLLHGSILVARSFAAPELAGWVDLVGVARLPSSSLVELWLPPLAARLRLSVEEGALSSEEEAEAHSLRKLKYGHSQWTHRR